MITQKEMTEILKDPRFKVSTYLVNRQFHVTILDTVTGLSTLCKRHNSYALCKQEALSELLAKIRDFEG